MIYGHNKLMMSYTYSLFSNNPRIRVDIKNESVSEEDASQSAVALTRVATLLKEVRSVVIINGLLHCSYENGVYRKMQRPLQLQEDYEDVESRNI